MVWPVSLRPRIRLSTHFLSGTLVEVRNLSDMVPHLHQEVEGVPRRASRATSKRVA
jgi:hypothetical protein